MKAIHKRWQDEFYAQKKSIVIVESFLLPCNLSAKQNTVTSHRRPKTSCSQKQYLFYAASTTAESDLCIARLCCLVIWRWGQKTGSKIKITRARDKGLSWQSTISAPWRGCLLSAQLWFYAYNLAEVLRVSPRFWCAFHTMCNPPFQFGY